MSKLGSLGKELSQNKMGGLDGFYEKTSEPSSVKVLEEGSDEKALFDSIEKKFEDMKGLDFVPPVDVGASVVEIFNDKEETNAMVEEVEKDVDLEMDAKRKEYLEAMYPRESIDIAVKLHKDISKILLGNSAAFTHEFSQDSTGINGLSFSLRSLNSGEDVSISTRARSHGWDSSPTNLSESLIINDKLAYSLIRYCGTDLSENNLEYRKAFVSKIPTVISKVLIDKLIVFDLAMNIISSGEEHMKLLKKFFARQ